MKAFGKSRRLAYFVSFAMLLTPLRGFGEDIDIFVGVPVSGKGNPNVLIVLDNTSNWARQNQHWPGGEQQGQSEVAAIKEVLGSLDEKINVGVMEFVTGGNANDNGGFIRFPVLPMDSTNKAALSAHMDTIYGDINGTTEKRNSNEEYGNLIADAYHYFAGENQSQGGAGTLASKADSRGYTSTYGSFKSPLSCGTDCSNSYIIFITNPNSSGPNNDDQTNTDALVAAGGSAIPQLGLPNQTTQTTNVSGVLGATSVCHASQSACTTSVNNSATADYTALDCANSVGGCTCTTAIPNTTGSCPAGNFSYSVSGTLRQQLGATSSCYKNANGIPNGYPSTQGQTVTETAVCGSGTTVSFSNQQQGACPTASNSNNQTYHWDVTCTGNTSTSLGSSSCYSSTTACQTSACGANYTSCTCISPTSTYSSCPTGNSKFNVTGTYQVTTVAPTGTYTADTNPFNVDEWARHMYQNGVPVAGCARQPVITYTMDVFNAQQNAQHTSLMLGMAKAGGGSYFAAKNKNDIVTYLSQIFREIQSVNSTFAAASLPISATNRTQNNNQVFFASFRPDPDTKPRWFGNVKQYKLMKDATTSEIILADSLNTAAVATSGYISDCAASIWTTDSGNYWDSYPVNPSFADGMCAVSTKFNDLPDGARVEKGGVAEVLRKGNSPASTATWSVNRTFYTESGGTLVDFSTANTGLSSTMVNWVKGQDTENEDSDISVTETRASIHGDVIHSRPLPVNYCLKTDPANCANTAIYYGANDGTLRAVDAFTGAEKWAFVAPEQFGTLDRLRTQSPLVAFPNQSGPVPTPAPTPRGYFFDGSIGLYQDATNSNVWIYPTMRRGGRMLYAFSVPKDVAPVLKWKFGCDASGTCTSPTSGGANNIGQTWSIPNVAKLKDDTTSKISIVMGGGYDTCEDADSASTSCSSPKGNQVYVLNADTGAVLKTFSTHRSVMADVSVIDIDKDDYIDYAYVGDTGGNLYRIAFSQYNAVTNTYSALASSAWTITRVAYTSGSHRKFQFAPAIYGVKGKVYIALGSGDRERPLITNYPYTTPVSNRFYMYRDCLPNGPIASSVINAGDDLDDTSKMNGSSATVTATCASPETTLDNCSTNKGWYIDLNNGTGEQTVTPALIAAGLVTFNTNRPLPANANVCTTGMGESRGYWLNLFTGAGAIGVPGSCGGVASATFATPGFGIPPIAATVTVDGRQETGIIGAVRKDNVGVNSPFQWGKSPGVAGQTRKKVYFQIKGDNK